MSVEGMIWAGVAVVAGVAVAALFWWLKPGGAP
jgi:hypothetical protein